MATGEQLARVDGPIRLAESARTANPGELLMLDNRGREVTKLGRMWMQVRLVLFLGGVVALPVVVLVVLLLLPRRPPRCSLALVFASAALSFLI